MKFATFRQRPTVIVVTDTRSGTELTCIDVPPLTLIQRIHWFFWRWLP